MRWLSRDPHARELRSFRRFVADGGDELLFPFRELSGTLIDLGGHEGRWTATMLERCPDCNVDVFEPVSASAASLEARFASDARVSVHAFGLGAHTRAEKIHVASESSSIYHRPSTTEAEQDVQIVDVSEWWNDAGIEAVDVMKINIEGGEFEVLPRLIETGLISRIAHLQVQFHTFVPGAPRRMRAILRELGRTHEPVYRYPFIWESWRRKAPRARL